MAAGAAPSTRASPRVPPRCGGRLRLAVLGLMLLAPLALLLLAEGALRLCGYGYATAFFLPAQIDGRPCYVENPRFGWRFFGPAAARTPQPIVLSAVKPAGSRRIFVFGESAAMGDPEPAYGFARQLERLLQARHPETSFQVVNVAMTAINSHVIREIARDCAPRGGDCWLVLAGNNEVVGPFGAGTVFGRQVPNLSFIRAALALKRTRLGQLLDHWFSGHPAGEWEGMRMFLGRQVPRTDPRLARVYEHFAKNLSAIFDLGRGAGARVIAATVPVNLEATPPFASLHRPGLGGASLRDWERLFDLGRQAEAKGRPQEALAAYQQAARLDGEFADLIFRRAGCELAAGQAAASRADFLLARDLDTLRFRADSRLNQTVRQTVAGRGVKLVDAEAEFARLSTNGVPGDAAFLDHVHFTFKGNYWLAALFAGALEGDLFPAPEAPKPGDPSGPAPPLLSEGEVARRLAFTDFDRRRLLEEMRVRFRQPPFVSQGNSPERDEALRQALARPAARPAELTAEYRAAIALAPKDWVLHANLGALLEAAADPAGAAAEWREVARLVPQAPDGWFHLGNLEYSAGHFEQATARFQEALLRQPDCGEAVNGLALVLAAQGKTAEAIARLKVLLQSKPLLVAARVNLAVQLVRAGKLTEALPEFAEALRLNPALPDAHYNYGVALAKARRYAEAKRQFQEALELRPDFPRARAALDSAASLAEHPN